MIWTIRTVIVQLINLVMAVITFLIGMRVVMKVLGANPSTPIVWWVMQLSDQVVYPFQGIFTNPALDATRTLDIVALIALLAYAIIAYLVISLIDSLVLSIAGPRTHRHVEVAP